MNTILILGMVFFLLNNMACKKSIDPSFNDSGFPNEIEKHTKISCNTISINLYDEVVFVAIKNGMHQGKGYSFYSKGIEKIMPKNKSHVKDIFSTINQFFLKQFK
jgi:hypothetical protein